jgi:YhcH/YjgK/YiaL family protein
MVIDTLDKLSFYENLNPLFKEVLAFLKEHDLNTMEEGKYPIKGSDVFLNLTTAKGKTADEAVMETHRVMLDIQIPLDTPEIYGYSPLESLPEETYNEEKDITKYPGVAAETYVTCRPGEFAIFWPQDGHAPCISNAAGIKKAIFKVKA